MAVKRIGLQERFQGALVGAVVGDCLGAPFEFDTRTNGIPLDKILKKVNPLSKSCQNSKTKFEYTDDTAMALSVCQSLLHNNQFNPVHMATCFAKQYQKEMDRGYGKEIVNIFDAWNKEAVTVDNVFQPSLQQFNGTGSYGNGAAMRVAPVALFSNNYQQCIDIAKKTALLTHSNTQGVNGAILQAVTLHEVLHSKGEIDPNKLLSKLKTTLSELEVIDKTNESIIIKENDDDIISEHDQLYEYTRSPAFSYVNQLNTIEELLSLHNKHKDECDVELVIKKLGCDVTAQQAVPTAIYCFLRNLDSGFEKTLYYAISLGGDTDTIGTMCGAIAGAYYGLSSIPKEWKNVCEASLIMKNYADQFYDGYVES